MRSCAKRRNASEGMDLVPGDAPDALELSAEQRMQEPLNREMRGGAMKRRDEVHRMAEANKAFSHFRF